VIEDIDPTVDRTLNPDPAGVPMVAVGMNASDTFTFARRTTLSSDLTASTRP
jgi:hypothetical protein